MDGFGINGLSHLNGIYFFGRCGPVDVMACDQRCHLSACGRLMIGVKGGHHVMGKTVEGDESTQGQHQD